MPGPVINSKNLKPLLPMPKGPLVQKLAEWFYGSTPEEKAMSEVTNMMGPMGVPGTVVVPAKRLSEVLYSKFVDKMLKETPSRVLRSFYQNSPTEFRIGSQPVAELASGVTPERVLTGYEELPEEVIKRTGGTIGPIAGIPRHERRLASDELYRISQAVLEEVGVPAHESVLVHRGGPLYKPGSFLTPTTVQEGIAKGFARKTEYDPAALAELMKKAGVDTPEKLQRLASSRMYQGSPELYEALNDLPVISKDIASYDVPRRSVRAVAGVLARGDDVSLSELLIPSIDLEKSFVSGSAPEVLKAPIGKRGGIPSRLRRQVAATK